MEVVDEDLKGALRHALRGAGVPGIAMAWIRRRGRTTGFSQGVADVATGRAVGMGTRFHLFSGTKLYTATAAARLVEQGRLAWDDRVRAHLPELPLGDDLELWHLASHCSGIPDTLRGFVAIHLADAPAPTADEALGRYRLDGGHGPGGPARYANVNYALLGAVLARVTGKRFEEVIQQEVLAPLGVEASFQADDSAADLATGHLPRLSPWRPILPWLLPSVGERVLAGTRGRWARLRPFALDTAAIGGLVGPAPAFLPLLDEMLAPTDGLLRAETKRRMLTLHARGAAGVASRDGVGLGWKKGTVRGCSFWNHEGGGPGFCTETRLYPDDGIGIVVLMNCTQSRRLSLLCHRLCERVRTSGLRLGG